MLFNDGERKDLVNEIEKLYFNKNFGSTSKVDFETMLFSKYLEHRVNAKLSYDDFSLSKELGITQSRIRALKERVSVKYGKEDYDWRVDFLKLTEHAIYEDEKIKLRIPERSLYLEIKNAIELNGGYVEILPTPNLLQVRLPYFFDLILSISGDEKKEDMIKSLKSTMSLNNDEVKLLERQSFGKALADKTPEIIIDAIGECIPIFGGVTKSIAKNLLEVVKNG